MDKPAFAILGLGSRSTLFYIKELNKLYNEKNGAYSTCPLLLLNANFNDINPLLPNRSKQLDAVVQQYINAIEKLDIDHILIPNITLHDTVDNLSVQKKIIHPLPLSVSKIKANKHSKIVLFGSLYSMQCSYINAYFKSNNIEVVWPSQTDMQAIDNIRKAIYSETETDDLIKNYHLLIAKYSKDFPVVLACTELSILKPTDHSNIFDMAQIQIETAINLSY